MERNALLAFVCSMIILFVYLQFVSPLVRPIPPAGGLNQPEKQTEKKEAGAPQGEATSPAAAQPQIKSSPAVTPSSSKAPRIITVENDLFKAGFTEAGARLVSFQLKKYRKTVASDSPPMEMVNEQALDRTPLGLESTNKSIPDLDQAIFTADKDKLSLGDRENTGAVAFSLITLSGVTIKKVFEFKSDSYLFDLSVTIENNSNEIINDNLILNIISGPFETTGNQYGFTGLGALIDRHLEEEEVGSLEKGLKKTGIIGWVGYENPFFISAVIPKQSIEATVQAGLLDKAKHVVKASFIGPAIQIRPQEKHTSSYLLYFGPKNLAILKSLNISLDRAIDFGWFDIIAKPFLYLFDYSYKVVHNYGISIIFMTILVKIVFWPLTHKSYKSMNDMKKIQPMITKLREKFKDDKTKLNQELMSLYKTYKVNPFGGCLPMLIQLPVFIALYRLLGGAIELRHAPFCLWINDLSAPDRLHIGFDIPFVGGIPVLTLLMGASMFLQQKMTPAPGDPTQAKVMMALPIVFTFMFINFPSGLVLYWLVNNIISIGQQAYINRNLS
ncbi:MAG: membrane protein insertase YidC [Deltaproteobacteria bacterium]|nr:membrane protein insertase YidC [Deltaproteobacteria bacterium]